MNLMDKLFDSITEDDLLLMKIVVEKSYLFTQLAENLSKLIDKLEVGDAERTDLINSIDRLVDEAEAEASKQGYRRGQSALFDDIVYSIDELKEFYNL